MQHSEKSVLATNGHKGRDLLDEGGDLEDLAADVGVHADELEAIQARERRDSLGGRPRGQRESELRVLLTGPHVLVGVRLDARGDP